MNNTSDLYLNPVQDISYRLLLRICYSYFMLSNFILQYYIFYISSQNFNSDFNVIYSYNYYLIFFINSSYLLYFFINITEYLNSTVTKILNTVINLLDLTLRSIGTILNSTVIFEPEFFFFTFYMWNILLIFNIYILLLVTKEKFNFPQEKKIPGKKIKSNDICSICLENKSDWILPCQHTYHFNCINQWYFNKKTCPYCRSKMD